MNVNFTDLNIRNSQYPDNFLDYVHLGRCFNDDARCSAPEGEFTDFNIWKRYLTEQELKDWTSCR